MIVPVATVIKFDRNGGPIKVSLTFDTMFLCTYELDLRESNGNPSVPPFPVSGDNTNPEKDEYDLPVPVVSNDGRTVLEFINVLDEQGGGGQYQCTMTFTQDGNTLGSVTTKLKQISGNLSHELLAARLVAK